MTGYDYRVEVEDGVLEFEAYRRGVNAYIRWRHGDRTGERGGLTRDGEFVYDVDEYVKSGRGDVVELPNEVLEGVREDLLELRREGVEDLGDGEAEALELQERVVERAREILVEEGAPEVGEYGRYSFSYSDSRGEHDVRVGVEARGGVAEVWVETDAVEGYSPNYDLDQGKLTLPLSDGFVVQYEVDVPASVAEPLLEDLIGLQEELERRREAYDDAVERAWSEVEDG